MSSDVPEPPVFGFDVMGYLFTKITPLADRIPEAHRLKRGDRKSLHDVLPANTGNRNRHAESLNRYKLAMGSGWVVTSEITARVNEVNRLRGFHEIASALPTLRAWEKLGVVESRWKDESKVRRGRIEWRWIGYPQGEDNGPHN
jgi:hypothetical protein